MLVNYNKLVPILFAVSMFLMAIPYFFNLGDGNVFRDDYIAKRIVTFFFLPIFLLLPIFLSFKKKLKISENITAYLIVYLLVLLISVLRGNRLFLIATDAFIAFIPVFFYLLIFKTNLNLEIAYKSAFLFLLTLAAVLVSIGVKLQYSYFTLLVLPYLLFYAKVSKYSILLLLLLPVIVVKGLIGKSALLMLIFLISYFFFFDKKNISFRKKVYVLLIPAILVLLSAIIFWDKLQQTGAYRNFTYFLRHADFSNLKFGDLSTGQRLYEAQIIIENFKENNFLYKIFGNGFGSTINLSGTKDYAIIASNPNLNAVRNIHIGFFAILSRFGLIGVFTYVYFIYFMIKRCSKILRKKEHFSMILGSLYILILLFDSMISFSHMMSNFMFWFIAFIIIKQTDE